MDSQRALLIINPISGTADKDGLDRFVKSRLGIRGINVDTAWTAGSGDATRLATEAVKAGYGSVIAAGGDGTINETAAALCRTGVCLGIIPCGSGNGLARHIGIPLDIEGAVGIIENGRAEECDYGSVNGRPFFCTFGSGFDATVSEKFASDKHRGRMTYIKNTFREYISYRPAEYVISADGHVLTQRAFLVAACNASQYGNNAYIAPHASITDGLLDLTIIHYGNLLTTALVGIDLLSGFIERNMLIHTLRTDHALIERSEAGPVHIDGEPMWMGRKLDIRCHKHGLKIYVPEEDRPFVPIITPVMSMMSDLRYSIERIVKNSIS
ncbi:MAG: diacylglycerol kinase family lipid kinase [Muribaculaceae bacterium]|nr:diacylglycerol kinase family lipid kinase [Muribaculaceae bacterium]